MRKIELCFTLVGNAQEWKRGIPEEISSQWTNADNLEFVREMVASYFGNRAMVITNEKYLKNDALTYPNYYSAGWFVDRNNGNHSELVMVGHGATMAEANKMMLESIQQIDLDKVLVKI